MLEALANRGSCTEKIQIRYIQIFHTLKICLRKRYFFLKKENALDWIEIPERIMHRQTKRDIKSYYFPIKEKIFIHQTQKKDILTKSSQS